jgi:hypothetical protein
MSPSQSLARAIMMDNGHRSTAQLKGVWCRLHSKSFGVIRTAIESTVGTSLFDDIEDEHQRFSFNILDETLTGKTLDTQFISGNAYYLWEKIRIRLDRFTPHDLSRLIDRYMNLKYTPRQDPAVFRREFDNSVRELRQAGLTIPDKLHLAVWYRALPPEFDSLRQALGANPDLTWNNIYDAIITQYSANYSIKKTTRKQEDEKALSAVEEAKKERLRRLKDKNKTKEEDAITDKKKRQKECTYCGKTGHTVDKCYALENDKKNADSFKQNGKQSDSEEDDEHAAPFVDDELLASWYQPSSDSDELVAKAGDLPLSQLPVHFLFDSAATTHVTPVKRIVEDLNDAPAMTMGTAINGQRSIITKRGKVRLNEKWTLRDVAFVPNASISLISEGRLADAGYTIIKNKDFVIVRNSQDKVVLRGPRVNRLWLYTVDGKTPDKKPTNTIIPSKPLAQKNVTFSDSSEKKDNPAPTQHRTIPKKGTQVGNGNTPSYAAAVKRSAKSS